MAFATRYGWWLATMVALAVMLQAVSTIGALGPFQSVALRITDPVERGLSAIFEPVATFLSTDAGDLRAENERLRAELADVERRLVEQQIDNERIDELEAALGIIEDNAGETYVAATRINIDRSVGRDVIRINKGTSSGIEVGMVVLSPQYTVIGSISEVTSSQAFVRLLDDSRSAISATVLESNVSGTLEGTLDGVLSLKYVQGNVRVGETVVTAGLGGGYPPGLLLGQVSRVGGSEQDLYRDITVEPTVRLSTVETVLVLTSFVPLVGP